MSTLLYEALGVFSLVAMLDFLWALYITAVARRRPLFAALNSALVTGLGGASVILYVREPLLLFAAMLGAFAGTLLAVREMPD